MKLYTFLFLISAASLAFQVSLTRLFSLAQGSHLAFMAVSLALLGAGASGTYLSRRGVSPQHLPRLLAVSGIAFVLSVPAAYLVVNTLPFDAYRLAWEPLQLLWLTLYYLALAVPFFFSGLAVAAALAVWTERAGAVYAANLLGSAVGAPLALLLLANFGGLLHVRLTPYKALSQALLYPGSDILISRWNAFSRVDVIRSDGIRSAPGLSFAYTGTLPSQLGLTVDGDNLTPVTAPGDPAFTAHLPLALAFTLRPNADVLILEPGGGLPVLAALQQGARSVTVVHGNPTTARLLTEDLAGFNGAIYHDRRVRLVVDQPRSFLRRTPHRYDLVIFPLSDSFHPVTAGAYSLNEDYRYTVQAFADALARLNPGGLLVAERWLQLPPSESLRLWAVTLAAHRRFALPAAPTPASTFAIRSMQTALVAASNTALPPEDLATIRRFARSRQFDLVYLPGIRPEEANRYSVVPEAAYYRSFRALVDAAEPDLFFNSYPFAVDPPTDNRPYFFNFFKWRQVPEIWQSLGKTWQPFGGSGYLMLVVLLGLAVLLSLGLILLPLLWQKTADPPQPGPGLPPSLSPVPLLLYFFLLGLGFLFVEIPLLQQFILYLGQPAYAFAVVVATLLAAAGAGSRYLSTRLSLRVALTGVVVLALVYPPVLAGLFEATIRLPWAGRVGIAVAALLPLGVLMGVPFPAGLRWVGRAAPRWVPWVWAVNGCASVVSAVLAALVSLSWGFSAVLWSAAAAYALAAGVSRHWD